VFALAAAGTLLVALAAAHALRTPAPRPTPVLATVAEPQPYLAAPDRGGLSALKG
jgi:hypothetical protein